MADKHNNGRGNKLDGPIKERMYVITLDNRTFAIVCDWYTLMVKAAAPIAAWTIGKSSLDVIRYYAIEKRAIVNVMLIYTHLQ